LKCLHAATGGDGVAEAALFKRKEVIQMPRFNGTGPMGAGPMTGGGRGYCAGQDSGFQPFLGRQGFSRGYCAGRGRGPGSGFRRAAGYPQGNAAQYNTAGNMNVSNEIRMLKAQATEIKSVLDDIQKRISELDKTPET